MKRVLVTRPAEQSGPLIKALEEQGFEPVALPLISIHVYTESSDAKACARLKAFIQDLDHYQHVIAISTNAAEYGLRWVDHFWPQLPEKQQWYAIGAATAEVLRSQGIEPIAPGQIMNSESLLSQPGLEKLQDQKVLIIRGKGGREFLKQELEKRGARVDYCEVYEREPVNYAKGTLLAEYDKKIDILTVTSAETIQLLLEQAKIDGIKKGIQRIPIIAPGDRLYNKAKEQGFQQVHQSVNAGIEAMMESVKKITITG